MVMIHMQKAYLGRSHEARIPPLILLFINTDMNMVMIHMQKAYLGPTHRTHRTHREVPWGTYSSVDFAVYKHRYEHGNDPHADSLFRANAYNA